MGKKTKAKQPEQPSASANGKAKGLPPTPPPDEDEATKQLGNNEPTVNKAKDKKKSGPKHKKKKSSGIFSRIYSAITFKRVFILYILYVVLVCSEKSAEELADSPFNQRVCTNGLSRYILEHDLFQRYVEPSILFFKVNYNEHARPHVEQALVQYDKHVKPHVNKAVHTIKEQAKPHIETANVYAQEYYNRGQDYYDANVREHVDKYYSQASEVATPYVVMARDHASGAYEKAQDNYEKRFLPWYSGKFLPWTQRMWVKAVIFFDSNVVPAAEKAWEKTKEAFDEYVVPPYNEHVHPHYEKYVLANYHKHVEPHYKYYVHPYVVRFSSWVQLKIVGKEELDRRAREADAKVQAERKRKADEAAKVATEAFVKKLDTAIKEYEKTVKKTTSKFDVDIRKPVKAALDEVNSEIEKLKASTEGEVDKIKVLVDKVTADSQKTFAEKKEALTQSTEESLERVTETARVTRLGISKTSTTVVDKLGSLKQTVEADLAKALKAIQKILTESTGQYPNADKSALRKFLRRIDEIRTSAKKDIEQSYDGDSANINQAITLQLGNVDYLLGEAEKVIKEPVNKAIASFEEQDAVPVEQVVIAVDEGKKSKEVPASTTSDPTLELLMKRREEAHDPVLKKLTAGYERYKLGLPPVEVSEPEHEEYGDEVVDDDEYGEHCDDPGEC